MFKTTIKTFACPLCAELRLTCTSKGRQGFADTPGKCARHSDIEMEEKERYLSCNICHLDNKICNEERMCLKTGERMSEYKRSIET